MTQKRIIRWLISGAVLSTIAFGAYMYVSAKASERVLSQMIKMAEQMKLPAHEKTEVRRLIASVHQSCFDAALDLTAENGKQFDQQLYFDRVFTDMIAAARAEGRWELAHTLRIEQGNFSFDAVEE